MRLLHTKRLEFQEFFDVQVKYSILSHRWSTEEVSYEQFLLGQRTQGYGWEKIVKLCEISQADDFEWTWIDTCCIDKSSSAELTEAINSMYAWYEHAQICYVFLPDVFPCMPRRFEDSQPDHYRPSQCTERGLVQCDVYDCFSEAEFRNSDWFKRGWTLQELLAPRQITFFNNAYRSLGGRMQLREMISQITKIPYEPMNFAIARSGRISFAKKVSWAASRQTSRAEDAAYCLLGLLKINMPLLYGEGRQRAFLRLQEEYLQRNEDDTIFVWERFGGPTDIGLLAPDPSRFRKCHDIEIGSGSLRGNATYLGVELEMPVPEVLVMTGTQASIIYPLAGFLPHSGLMIGWITRRIWKERRKWKAD